MFESAELGHKIDKATYDAEVPKLREDLLNAQFDLAQKAKFPVIILIGGVDGAGNGETVNLLNAWMDLRHIQAHAMGENRMRNASGRRYGASGARCRPRAKSVCSSVHGIPRPSRSASCARSRRPNLTRA